MSNLRLDPGTRGVRDLGADLGDRIRVVRHLGADSRDLMHEVRDLGADIPRPHG
jgi:hypothetical protein